MWSIRIKATTGCYLCRLIPVPCTVYIFDAMMQVVIWFIFHAFVETFNYRVSCTSILRANSALGEIFDLDCHVIV